MRTLHFLIGFKNSCHFFNQWEAKPKPVSTCTWTPTFSRPFGELLVSHSDWFKLRGSYSDWFIVAYLIGQRNYFIFHNWKIRELDYDRSLFRCLVRREKKKGTRKHFRAKSEIYHGRERSNSLGLSVAPPRIEILRRPFFSCQSSPALDLLSGAARSLPEQWNLPLSRPRRL